MIRTLTIVFSVLFTASSLITNPALAAGPETPKQITIEQPQANSCYAISNQGEDTSASVYYQDQLLFRAASWRGVEGTYYFATPALIDRIEIKSFESSALSLPPAIDIISCHEHLYSAIHNITIAIDEKLKVFFGQNTDNHQAIEQLKQALHQLPPQHKELAAHIHFEQATTHTSLAQARLAEAQYRQALLAYEDLLQEQPDSISHQNNKAAVSNVLGRQLMEEGKLNDAQELFEQALSLRIATNSAFYIAQSNNNLGLIAEQQGRRQEAIQHYESALNFFQNNLDLRQTITPNQHLEIYHSGTSNPYLSQAINTLNNLAVLYDHIGDETQAETLWNNALIFNDAIKSKLLIAQINNNYGRMLLGQNRIAEAFELLFDASQSFYALKEHNWYASSLIHLSQIYELIGDQEHALSLLEEAAQLNNINIVSKTELWRSQAKLLMSSNDYDLACPLLEKAYLSYLEAEIEYSYLQLQAEYAECLSHAQAQTNIKTIQFEAHQKLIASGLNREATVVQSMIAQQYAETAPALAATLLKDAILKHKRQGNHIEQLKDIMQLLAHHVSPESKEYLDYLTEGLWLSEQLYQQKLPPLWRAELINKRRTLYEYMVQHQLNSGQAELAFYYAEAIRGRGYLAANHIDNSDIAQNKDLLSTLNQQQHTSPTNTQRTLRQIDALAQQETYTLPEDWSPTFSLTELQQKLTGSEKILSYFIGENTALLWLISNNGFEYYRLPLHSNIEHQIVELQQKLQSPRSAQGAIWQLADDLSKQLLPQDAVQFADTQRLYVLPDGPLHEFPFALLNDQDPQQPRYVYERSEVVVVPNILMLLQGEEKTKKLNNIAIFADPQWQQQTSEIAHNESSQSPATRNRYHFSQQTLSALPGTRQEAQAISAIAQQHHLKTQLYTGTQVNIQTLYERQVQSAEVLHIATHGILNTQHPSLSSLAFTHPKTHTIDSLWPNEISHLQLDAQLVVLSACDTARGKRLRSEGVLSLTRPFLQAGAAQVIATQWKVNDQRTSLLMQNFYDLLIDKNRTAADALSSTQRWAAKHPQLKHPHYWAGLSLFKGF
jgi:CHAT domain-containing protein/Tfp pilus assembly protein PilF